MEFGTSVRVGIAQKRWWGIVFLGVVLFRGPLSLGADLDPYAKFRVSDVGPDGTPKRIVAIGDMHGDLEGPGRALIAAGALDAESNWVGENLVVVTTGDYLDRGEDDLTLINELSRLHEESKRFDSRNDFVELNGNHEYLNLMHDFQDVNEESASEFHTAFFRALESIPGHLAELNLIFQTTSHLRSQRLSSTLAARAIAFSPQGREFERFAQRRFFAIVGNTVFVHGGIREASLDYGLEKTQEEVDEWMNRGRSFSPIAWISSQNSLRTQLPLTLKNTQSPIWSRVFGQIPADPKSPEDPDWSNVQPWSSQCAELDRVLTRMRVKRMVVGHTVQPEGEITSACHGKVWRIDVGLSGAMWPPDSIPKDYQALEIQSDEVRVLKTPRQVAPQM